MRVRQQPGPAVLLQQARPVFPWRCREPALRFQAAALEVSRSPDLVRVWQQGPRLERQDQPQGRQGRQDLQLLQVLRALVRQQVLELLREQAQLGPVLRQVLALLRERVRPGRVLLRVLQVLARLQVRRALVRQRLLLRLHLRPP